MSGIRIHGTLRNVWQSTSPRDGTAALHFQLAGTGQQEPDVRGRKVFGIGSAAQYAAASAMRRLRRGLPCTVHAAGWAVDKDQGQVVLVGVDVIDQGHTSIRVEVPA